MKRFLPLLAGVVALLCVAVTLVLPKNRDAFDTQGFGRLPVLVGGRLKPLDTVARTSLLLIQNRQRVKTPDGRSLTPNQWLLDALFKPALADTYQVFRIDNNEVLALLRLSPDDGAGGVRFSFAQLAPHLDDLDQQAERAAQLEPPEQNAYEREVLKLRNRLHTYLGLRYSLQLPESADFAAEIIRFEQILPEALAATEAKMAGKSADEALVKELAGFLNKFQLLSGRASMLAIPPPPAITDHNAWSNFGDALLAAFATSRLPQPVRDYAALGSAWRAGDPELFNRAVTALGEHLVGRDDPRLPRTGLEFRFNHAEPFYWAAALYVLVALLGFVSWLAWPDVLARSALWVGIVAWLLTTAGIVARMYIESRPPVTNLYSSALFVGWVGSGLALLLERFFRNSIGNVVAGVLGFVTLLVAHHLQFSGDTMEMMRAVLDDNFWLATHVVTITMGYGACFVAGVLALLFVLRGTLSRSLDSDTAQALLRMTYGAVCFATLFSLVGTVLGGIWADQSWGRFWGWDPKENGALVIVLWNAVILHARWGKLVGPRGFMNLAIFGNCITAASWFGVNMLGVGLHSYGFMDSAFFWLCAFWASQLAIIGLGCLPPHLWRSRAAVEA
ncbi:MAG TPA: cytochrome c biogenesis protein CcsA [Opitutaceae bacterium]|nr:cytochrome c biogenesis protein CcsA [Opitutaceae bacterium]